MKLLDLFSGIGGFSLAFKRVFNGEIIGYAEIDKYASKVYEQHFPGVKALGTVTDIQPERLPDFDICTFGFPCQDLSIAGKREGFGGRRSSLFHEAIRIIDKKRPKYFVFENVKGLYSSRKGEDFIEVLQAITDIGYSGQWQLLNTKWFLPQNRERIYFVGHLRGERRPEIFPIGEDGGESASINGEDCSYCIGANYHKGTNKLDKSNRQLIQVNNSDTQGYRVYSTDGISQTLAGEAGGLGAKTGLYAVSPTIRAEHHNTADVHFIRQKARGFNEGADLTTCPTLSSNSFEHNNHVGGIRRLTPLECERLQGFPDGWTEGLSDTQRYKTLGNAITVNVAEEIFKRLKKFTDSNFQ